MRFSAALRRFAQPGGCLDLKTAFHEAAHGLWPGWMIVLAPDPSVESIKRIVMKAHVDRRADPGGRSSPSSFFYGANN